MWRAICIELFYTKPILKGKHFPVSFVLYLVPQLGIQNHDCATKDFGREPEPEHKTRIFLDL